MFKHLLEIDKIDRRTMIATCLIDFICGVIYLTTVLTGFERGLNVPFWLAFFPFASGATMVLDVIVLRAMFTKRLSRHVMTYLLVFSGIQMLTILAEIIFSCVYGGFWEFGYIYIALEAMLGIAYLRRYFIVKEIRKAAKGDENGAD